MAAKKNKDETGEFSHTPSQEDEADILDEAGAEFDEELGVMTAPEETVRKLGAVDADSIRQNRRSARIADKKRKGEARVPFNTRDPFVTYETLLKTWTSDTFRIRVTRLSGGSSIQMYIQSQPRNSEELYTAIMAEVHKQHPEATYEIRFLDAGRGSYRGAGRTTLPDTQGQARQPMGYAQQPGFQPQQGYPQQPPQPPQAPAQQTPVVMQAPVGPDPLSVFRQAFELFTQMQDSAAARAQPTPPIPIPPTMPVATGSPTDPISMMRQFFEFYQSMQPPTAAAPSGAQPTAPMPNPMAAAMGMGAGGLLPAPPFPPPAGTVWMPPFGFVPTERVGQIYAMLSGAPAPEPPRGPTMHRRPYNEGGPPYTPPYATPAPPPQRERSATEQLREAMGFVRTAAETLREFETMLPGREVAEPVEAAPNTDNNAAPYKILDIPGKPKLLLEEDGSVRKWESLAMNMPDIFKWVGEQAEKWRSSQASRPQQPQRALPPGLVEVTPGYQPPPGMVAIPIDRDGNPIPQAMPGGLAPPPIAMPPVIQSWDSTGDGRR